MATVLAPSRTLLRARLPSSSSALPALVFAAGILLAWATRLPGPIGARSTMAAVAFVALVVESLPFLLIGAVIVALIQRGPVGGALIRAGARHPFLSVLLAPFMGSVLPLCDCGLVPVARQIHSSGAAPRVVNSFVAGAPLTNPIVILSTVVAFPGSPGMVVGRVLVGLGVAMIAAVAAPPPARCEAPVTDPHDDDHAGERPGILTVISGEFVRSGPTLIAGALVAGALKGFLPSAFLVTLETQPLAGAAGMMVLAFLISICSQADAFVAAALPVGNLSRLAFLVLGPMLDLRLAALYRREFGTRWLAGYASVVIPSVLVLATVWGTWVTL